MTNTWRTWRTVAVAGLTLGAFACSESATEVVEFDGPIPSPQLAEIDLSMPPDAITINGALWTFPTPFQVGTGNINPFLQVQRAGNSTTQEGFNNDLNPAPLDAKHANTESLPLNYVPTIEGPGGGLFREIILDANESNSTPDAFFSIDRFDLWLCNDPAAPTFDERSDFDPNANCSLVYDIDNDVGGDDVDHIKATDAATKGSGNALDYQILIPEQDFIDAADLVGADLTDCAYQGVDADPCGAFLILDTKMGFQGGDLIVQSTFEEFSTILRPFVIVTKDANPTFVRTHDWDIEKSVDIDQHNLDVGETGTSEYTVDVIYNGFIDSDWAVSGEITIENPSEDDVLVEGITDEISGVGVVPVVCPEAFPFTLASGATVVCTYESDLPDGTNRTNSVQVDVEDLAVGTAMADIDFAEALIDEVDETATIDDSVEGALGNATAPNEPSFTYTRDFTCDEDEGDHPNTATITADDTQTQHTDDESVNVSCLDPDIEIVKTAEAELINAGEDARFTITMTNNGPGTALGATINDPLPAALNWSLDSFSPDPAASCAVTGAVGTQELDCGPLDLADGEFITATVSATTSVANCASYPNVAEGDASNHPIVDDDALIVCQVPQEDETAWASNEEGVPLELPFNTGGNGSWATYVEYDGAKTTTLYAGQTQDVGTVEFSDPVAGMVTITITLTGGAVFAPGAIVAVQDYSSAPSGNPSPGQFDHKTDPDTDTTASITVPLNNFYAVHTVVIP